MDRQLDTNAQYDFSWQDPKEYIKTILDVYQKFNNLVTTAFKHDPGFVAALDKGCGTFINKNTLTKSDSLTILKINLFKWL